MTEPQINTKDIVLRLDEKVDRLISDVGDLKVIAATVGTTVETLHDHEMRLRVLEDGSSSQRGESEWKRWFLPIGIAFATALSNVLRFIHIH